MAKVFVESISPELQRNIEAPDASQIPSAPPNPVTGRMPIQHLLIGRPPAVRHTIHRLHQIRYAEANSWSTLLVFPNRRMMLALDEEDVVATLRRSLYIE